MVEFKLHKSDLKHIVTSDKVRLRDGVADLMSLAHAHRVPLHVFSAGIYDVIDEYFKFHRLDAFEPRIVSNVMDFADDGRLLGADQGLHLGDADVGIFASEGGRGDEHGGEQGDEFLHWELGVIRLETSEPASGRNRGRKHRSEWRE